MSSSGHNLELVKCIVRRLTFEPCQMAEIKNLSRKIIRFTCMVMAGNALRVTRKVRRTALA